MMKMWKLSHTGVSDYGERQTMSHLMTFGDAPNCMWADLPHYPNYRCQTLSLLDSSDRELDEEEVIICVFDLMLANRKFGYIV